MKFELTELDIHILSVGLQLLLEQTQETPEQQAYREELAEKIDQILREMGRRGIETATLTLQGEQ